MGLFKSKEEKGMECLKKADAFFRQNNYTEAVKMNEKAAGYGNITAMCNLGYFYRTGTGTAQNYEKALHWYTLAADAGDETGLYFLGYMKYEGLGTPEDFHGALKLIKASAEMGYDNGMYHYAVLILAGADPKKTRKDAIEYLKRAALEGHPSALKLLNEKEQTEYVLLQKNGKPYLTCDKFDLFMDHLQKGNLGAALPIARKVTSWGNDPRAMDYIKALKPYFLKSDDAARIVIDYYQLHGTTRDCYKWLFMFFFQDTEEEAEELLVPYFDPLPSSEKLRGYRQFSEKYRQAYNGKPYKVKYDILRYCSKCGACDAVWEGQMNSTNDRLITAPTTQENKIKMIRAELNCVKTRFEIVDI